MFLRTGVLGLAGVLVGAGAAAAKPPGLPAGPPVEGREPTPIAREFHQPDARPAESLLTWWAEPAPLEEFFSGLRSAVLNRLTVPLGRAPVGE